MRLLFLTNFYPPAELGGWEQLCREMVEALSARGHEVAVLTSRFRRDRAAGAEPRVHRVLHLESDPFHYSPANLLRHLAWQDKSNHDYLRKLVADFQPDVISIWGMWLLNPQLAVLSEDLCRGRVAYYLCGFWPSNDWEGDPHTAYWRLASRRRWLALAKRPVAELVGTFMRRRRSRAPDFAHVACVSQFVLDELRRGGLGLSAGRVIYNGIDLQTFCFPVAERFNMHRPGPRLRLLYAGSITPQKGPETAVRAIATLAARHPNLDLRLTLAGMGPTDFVDQLKAIATEHSLNEHVRFLGWIARREMPMLLRESDVLLFTSSWQEPLARVMMEGMAAGVALVTTVTGGTGEVITPGVDALAFAPGDADDLAAQIERLVNNPALLRQLAEEGQQTAIRRFDFRRMTDEMEAFLAELAPAPCTGQPLAVRT
jgi:glycosyltransferase involved in cell wall biosynthesis